MTDQKIKFHLWPAIAAILALIIFLAAIVYFVQVEARNKIDHMLALGTVALPEILPDHYPDKILQPGEVPLAETEAVEAKLSLFVQRSGLDRIYAIGRDADGRVYVTASSHGIDEVFNGRPAGLTVYDAPPQLLRAFESGQAEFTTSRGGRDLRTRAVREIGPGGAVFLACADMDVSDLQQVFWRNVLASLVVLAAFVILIGLLLRSMRKAAYMYGKLSELARANSELYRLASYDNLTGLLGRGKFFDLAEAQLRSMTMVKSPGAIIMLDIDNFKKVNDLRGHAMGDQVLKAVAHVCRMSLRSYDLVGRYGGEEIVMLLVRLDAGLAEAVAERLRRSISLVAFDDQGEEFSVSATMGLVSFTHPEESLNRYVELADQELLKGKASGKNRVCHLSL